MSIPIPHYYSCPHCNQILTLYHMEWSAVVCIHCKEEVYQ